MDAPTDLLNDLTRWILAFAGALLIAFAALRAHALAPGGALAAFLLGTVIVGAGGWWAGVLLITFFATSSLLSRIGPGRTASTQARGSRRDAVQVLANGGIALLAAIGYGITGHAAWLLALAGSLAAANADTWSTEIGRTSPSRPRLIISLRPVPPGTSGAVSARGLLAAVAGSVLVAAVAAIGVATGLMEATHETVAILVAITVAGTAGSLVDSLLGTTVQERRWCDSCDTATERAVHRCGTPTRHIGGIGWVTNDVVNFACVVTGAVAVAGIATMLS